MIYPDVHFQEWLERYESLNFVVCTCHFCGEILGSTRPFISKDYIGLVSPEHKHGNRNITCANMFPYTEQEKASWGAFV